MTVGRADHLDAEFVAAQRRRLEALRRQARRTQSEALEDRGQLHQELEEPRDQADRGAAATGRDADESVARVEAHRLAEIERALEKIDEGSYGLSDESGEPIPRERLEAKPEAVRTVAEEEKNGLT